MSKIGIYLARRVTFLESEGIYGKSFNCDFVLLVEHLINSFSTPGAGGGESIISSPFNHIVLCSRIPVYGQFSVLFEKLFS